MGFNFQAGHPSDFIEDELAQELERRIGTKAVGPRSEPFCLDGELGWSWWSELQDYACAELGEAGSVHIRGVDAWEGVYVDAPIAREVLFPPGKRTRRDGKAYIYEDRVPWHLRLLRKLGLAKYREAAPEVAAAMHAMIQQFGSRDEDYGGLQVGNIRGLRQELDTLLDRCGISRTTDAVLATLESYQQTERLDDDPHIQCLCHAWLTAHHAMKIGSPMWLIK